MDKIRVLHRNDIMKRKTLTRKQKEHIAAYLFILPSFLGMAVFYIVPYIICFTKSLYVGDTFVGIENYIQLFQNNTFLLALKNTGIFTVTAIAYSCCSSDCISDLRVAISF